MKGSRRLLWAALLVLGFAVMAGGCGGGGGGSSDSGGYTPGDGGNASEIDLSAVSGTWVASEGRGTASGYGHNYQLRLDEGGMIFEILNADDAEGEVRVISEIFWNVYEGNLLIDTLPADTDGVQQVLVSKKGTNSFRYTFQSGSYLDVTFLSESKMRVDQNAKMKIYWSSGIIETYSFSVTYYMDKTSNYPVQPDVPDYDPPFTPAQPDENDLADYSGTWTAVPGSASGTATGSDGTYTLGLSSGTTNLAFSNVTSSSAAATVTSRFVWNSYYNGYHVSTIPLNYTNERVAVSLTSPTSLQYAFEDGSTVSVTLTGATSATVTERGTIIVEGIRYQYQGTYRMQKTS
jgi:hypothetical protein